VSYVTPGGRAPPGGHGAILSPRTVGRRSHSVTRSGLSGEKATVTISDRAMCSSWPLLRAISASPASQTPSTYNREIW